MEAYLLQAKVLEEHSECGIGQQHTTGKIAMSIRMQLQ